MKNLIVSAAVAITALFIIGAPVQVRADDCCQKKCSGIFGCKKKCSTVEVCRRCYTKAVCVCGCVKQINYVEVTYCTTYCDGSTKNWTKTYRI